MATGRPVAKTLIKYNINSLEGNDEEEKKTINIELTENKDPYNDENAIDFKWSAVQEEEDEEDIALANFSESLQSKLMRKIFQKSKWMIAVSYLIKRKIKDIFLEVISNTKIFYINFFNEVVNDQDFAKLTWRGLDKVEYGIRLSSNLIRNSWASSCIPTVILWPQTLLNNI